MRRVFVAAVLGLAIGALTSVGPARAGGSWLYPTGDSFQAGDNVTLVGYTGGGQLGWVDDGPFYAYLRVGAAAGDPSPSVMPSDVPLGPLTIEETGKGGYLTLRASLTFRVPAGLEPRRYDVVYCNDPCTTGLGDLVGGFVDVGVPAIAPIQRTWPPDDPAWALVATRSAPSGADATMHPSENAEHVQDMTSTAASPKAAQRNAANRVPSVVAGIAVVAMATAITIRRRRRAPRPRLAAADASPGV